MLKRLNQPSPELLAKRRRRAQESRKRNAERGIPPMTAEAKKGRTADDPRPA